MTYHKKELKMKILETTYDLINQKGYRDVSIRMIARKLSVSPTAIYRHYKSYADLMKHVIQKAEIIFSDYLILNLDNNTPLFDKLSLMAENYISFCLEYANLYDLMFISEYTPITCQQDMICDLGTQGMDYLISTIDAIIRTENLHVEVERLLTQFWAYIQGYSYLIRFHHFEIDKHLLNQSINDIIGGWK